ncbi:superoxide dismutase [Cu-Zn] SodC [Pseudomonas sp. Gutcm_11s]|uniref:superoxide dismutase [Cu-Zn] SodC n=1 Tax=Pseudomonas sp. Gutcm_11s TaxID=3026088 RepID=UPI0023624EB4|nr:superoxide dismutase [Cu-Zn] SodC [Pseudomonas sp. Gutcm_11s]MDD0843847.1 superoxide dismutase [Cu-Zn] SodC [Pseudomonas sp. Gutcm_11s]
MRQWTLAALLVAAGGVQAAPLSIPLNAVDSSGIGKPVGTIQVEQSRYGLVFTPALSGLAPGIHGFHLHTNPDCAPGSKDGQPSAAEMAGGHWDPDGIGKHGTPWQDDAHRGDLPPLYVDAAGKAEQPVLAPRLKSLDELKGHALMVHAGGDNHADHPKPLGGGGARVACGVIR